MEELLAVSCLPDRFEWIAPRIHCITITAIIAANDAVQASHTSGLRNSLILNLVVGISRSRSCLRVYGECEKPTLGTPTTANGADSSGSAEWLTATPSAVLEELPGGRRFSARYELPYQGSLLNVCRIQHWQPVPRNCGRQFSADAAFIGCKSWLTACVFSALSNADRRL